MFQSLIRFLDHHLEEVIGSVMLAVMACIAFINVIVRYCTTLSFSSSEEITVNFFVWVVLLGTSCAFREGSNFCMNLAYNAMPPAVRKVLYFFGLACCIVFFAALTYLGGTEVLDEMALNVSSESLDMPVWLYTMVTPLASALCIVRILQRLAQDLREGTI